MKIVQLKDGLAILNKGVSKLKKILEGFPEPSFTTEEYINTYTAVYNLCSQPSPYNYSQDLYDKYLEILEEYINLWVLPTLNQRHDEFMLRELEKRWLNHKIMMRWLSRFFEYLDRHSATQNALSPLNKAGLTPLNKAGLICFRDMVYKEVKFRARDAVITLINKEREGEQIDRALLKNIIDVIIRVGMGENECYEKDFEAFMLDDSSSYYSRKASNWIAEDSCPDYMLKAEECLKKEKERVSHYLHSSTEVKLLEKVQNELLVAHRSQLLEKEHSGCRGLLKDGKVEDLSRMFRLFSRTPQGLEPVANIFKKHIMCEGTALIQQAEDAAASKAKNLGGPEQAFVQKVLELHDKYMKYVNDCFTNHALFHKALKEGFEVVCNKNVSGSSSAELLASFCNNILTKGVSNLTDEAYEETLDKVVKLLPYISEKDLFAEFCSFLDVCFLTRVLATIKKDITDKAETTMWCTIYIEDGGDDMTLAKEKQNEFVEYLTVSGVFHPGIDFNVTVLTTGFWPTYKSSDLNLPPEMVKCVEVFKNFYETNTKKRKLTWIHSLGNCTVTGRFDTKTIELNLLTFQAAALLLFNTAEKLSYLEVQAQLNLSDDDLVRVLQSLSCAKYKILKKTPSSNTVSSTDYFEFNSKFTDKMRKIRIPLPPLDERRKIVEDVDKDRRYAIDASLVRIMKSRKVLGHQQLVTECVEQMSRMFKPDFKLIKRRIEDLIARDYLERDKENPNTFKYIA